MDKFYIGQEITDEKAKGGPADPENGYLRPAVESDMDLLFEWANEPLVRKNSFTTKEIAYEEHKKWFYDLLKDDGCRQYIYVCNGEAVGQARVKQKGDTGEISYSVCAEKRGMGYGRRLLQMVCMRAKEDFPMIRALQGEVKPDNEASKKAFLNAGFSEKKCTYEIALDACGEDIFETDEKNPSFGTEEKIYVTQSSMPPYEEYIEMIKPLWTTRCLTNMGEYHQRLERELQKYLKSEREISLTANGHMALEMAIQSMNFPAGSEVITTPFTFISTTHAIIRNRLTPVFCDISEDFTIDASKIEELVTEKTVAIAAVHVFGNICDVEEIERIAYKYNLKVIYDAAHAFGETYKGKSVSEFGDVSVFSFHATKAFHTIEGGAVCCSQKEQYERMYNLKNFGIRSQELVVSIGANAKMNEFQAAMGLCNLRYTDREIEKRKRVAQIYEDRLSENGRIVLNHRKKEISYNYAYVPALFESEKKRNRVYTELMEYNVFTRKYFYPITADAACFKNKFKNSRLQTARAYAKRILALPIYADLEPDCAERIAELVKRVESYE